MTNLKDSHSYSYHYLAKQPIFDKRGNTYGYELLFRSGAGKDQAFIEDGDMATMSVATAGFIRAQENIDQSKRIFVNFTEHLLLEGAPRALPPSVTVVEILEHTLPVPKVTSEIIRLKQDGYVIAIDDYSGAPELEDLLNLADIIKVDVLGKTPMEIEQIFGGLRGKKALKLAEKVEDRAAYSFLEKLGFDFFQGYYFAKPENLQGRTLHSGQLSRLKILTALNSPTLTPDEIIDVVSVDPTITYRLLRLLNSAAFSFSMKIDSIRHAVTLLGINRMRYWLRMVVMSDMVADDKPQELLILALNRGKLLEYLGETREIKTAAPENLFLFGMLSLIDVMLDTPMTEIVEHLPLSETLKKGYTDPESSMAEYLQVVSAAERGDNEALHRLCEPLGLHEPQIAEAATRALEWTGRISRSLV